MAGGGGVKYQKSSNRRKKCTTIYTGQSVIKYVALVKIEQNNTVIKFPLILFKALRKGHSLPGGNPVINMGSFWTNRPCPNPPANLAFGCKLLSISIRKSIAPLKPSPNPCSSSPYASRRWERSGDHPHSSGYVRAARALCSFFCSRPQ